MPIASAVKRLPVSIVVPCYNEEAAIPHLASRLQCVEAELANKYDLSIVLVDDGSTDGTWQALQHMFGSKPNVTFVQQENRGVAAAILAGIEASSTEIVCSMDCDCTYDPQQFRELIPMLTKDTALVTGSPYHPQGNVLNVPPWRLKLSKISSFLYSCVLHQKLFTYTSCFRVYRRSIMLQMPLSNGGYLGIAEMLARLDLQGSAIRECPATLTVRKFGQSKMRIVPTIAGHLGLLASLMRVRMFESAPTHVLKANGQRTPKNLS